MHSQIQGFNDYFRTKTTENALQVLFLYKEIKGTEEIRILGKQLLRSATSVAANFRSACRVRSASEHFAKMCIVVEECDETLFWLEIIEQNGWVQSKRMISCIEETKKLLMALAKARKNLKPPQ